MLAAASVAVVAGTQASAETLTDALVLAYRNSHLLEQNRAVLRAADEGVALSVATLRPVVNFIAQGLYQDPATASTYNKNLYGSLALSASMNLYDFGRTDNAIKAAKEQVLATREALVGVEQQVLLAAATAYLNVRQNMQTVALQQNNVNVLKQELKATQDKFDVGEVTKTDVAQAQAALAASQAALVAAQGNLQVSREAFKAAVGAYPGQLAAPPRDPATATSLAAAQSVAQKLHPSMLQSQHLVAAANYTLQRAADGANPSLAAALKSGIDNKSNTGTSLTLTLTQPIYAGGQIAAAYRQAAAQNAQVKAAQMQTALTVSQNVGNAWAGLEVARASITANRQQVSAAQVAFDGVREEAKLGSRTTLDVLTAEQTLLNARVSLVTAETQAHQAAYNLLSAMGLLTAQHLKLGVPSYDPAAYYNAVRHAPASGFSSQSAALDRIMKRLGQN
ncbi:MAG: TolC family outer membrane protein [Paracoccaceae bacterium]|nr:TolC family outer membrane protein [Paracoccaceae bacterium]MDE3120650.1 TolC family outer membrane protein [Paracoccaceae bacterium]